MSAEQGSEDALRLRVHRDQGIVKFFGCIGDTPDFALLDGIVEDGITCDFEKLAFASWIGLASLGSYFASHGFKLRLRGIPFNIFDSLRLIATFEAHIIESAEVPFVKGQNAAIEMATLDFQKIRAGLVQGTEWIRSDAGLLSVNPVRFLYPDLGPQRSASILPLKIRTDEPERISFWLCYGSFCQSTIKISSSLVSAARFSLLLTLYEIKAKMIAGEEALKLIDPKMSYTLVDRMDKIIRETIEDLDGLSESVQAAFNGCEQKLAALTLVALDEQASLETFSVRVDDYAASILELTKIASISEDCGVKIGSRISSLRSTQIIKSALAQLAAPSDELLSGLRTCFAIMDIMSEDDWFATRPLIMAELDFVETLIGRCIVTLQVFDMMRQILEHRIKEMTELASFKAAKGQAQLLSFELSEIVLEKIGAQLVTDQEKAAFAFFMPEGFARFGQTERKEPGDMLLF